MLLWSLYFAATIAEVQKIARFARPGDVFFGKLGNDFTILTVERFNASVRLVLNS